MSVFVIKAFVGSGGKTTLLKKQAALYRQQGLRVFVTTTTHMLIEEDTLLTDDAQVIIRRLEETGYAMAGRPFGNKIIPLSLETYQGVCMHADVVLVEADGSKHMPIKFPNSKEPVIYENTDEIVVVCGLCALGKRMCDVAHRLELVKECLGVSDHSIVMPEHIEKLVWDGYVSHLRKKYPRKIVRVFPTHDGSEEQMVIAERLKRL